MGKPEKLDKEAIAKLEEYGAADGALDGAAAGTTSQIVYVEGSNDAVMEFCRVTRRYLQLSTRRKTAAMTRVGSPIGL